MNECMYLNCHAMCTFPNLCILSPTRCFLYNFPKHQRLHLPEHPMTAARLIDMIKETLCIYSLCSTQRDCFNPKFYIEISHYICEPSSKKFYQHCRRMQITLKRGISRQAYKPLPAEWTSDTHASHPLLLGPADSCGSQGTYCSGLDRLEPT